ncbi:MAG: prepilin-type N-terminal cleavage/methylation domain-containing protein [Bacilli bacterium]|nr:prepilin-type N-terminal cleavage/methylation domain-containing protein [Bacilli bacterium]
MNKDGFTLVELLAVFVILAIILGLSVVGVNSVIKNSKDGVYKSNINTLKSAAQNYVIDNIDLINSALIRDDNYSIDFENLKSYINLSSLNAPNGGTCDSSYVIVSKDIVTNKYNYKYQVCLICKDGDNLLYKSSECLE